MQIARTLRQMAQQHFINLQNQYMLGVKSGLGKPLGKAGHSVIELLRKASSSSTSSILTDDQRCLKNDLNKVKRERFNFLGSLQAAEKKAADPIVFQKMLNKEAGHAASNNVTNLGLGKSKLQLLIECGYDTGQVLVNDFIENHDTSDRLEMLQTKLKGDKVILEWVAKIKKELA
eukprot:scaffold183008_cov40-Attheya_sp.AAC.1